MNRAFLIGNLGKDPEVKQIEGGTSVGTFSLATSSKYKNKAGELIEDTQWHNITVWGKLAEIAAKYLKKGTKIAVEGEIRYREYEKDGQKKYFTEIKATTFEMLSPKDSIETSAKAIDDYNPNTPAEEDDLPF